MKRSNAKDRQRRHHRAGWGAGGRSLRLEGLESRIVFANASEVVHSFREDDFSITGSFSYQMRVPEEFDYIDTISNGRYVSSAGHVTWTSPISATGFFRGTATGDGQDTVNFAGRRTCSEYGIEDIGQLDFELDAAAGTFKVTDADATSTRYTYYRDMTGGFCEQPDPPWSRFFGGLRRFYAGTFSPTSHQVAVNYNQTSPVMTVNAPAATAIWSNTAANDFSITARALAFAPELPDGYFQAADADPPVNPVVVDVQNGGLEIQARMTGKLPKTSTPTAVVSRVRLFWADSTSDLAGAEIPVTSSADPVGLYWNSASVVAKVADFPAAPPSARFLRATLDGSAVGDSNPLNNSVFLPIAQFEARDSTIEAVNADNFIDGASSTILNPLDRADPSIVVFAYQPVTSLGGELQVFDETGSFKFYPNYHSARSLGAGEITHDTVRFIAMKDSHLLDEATLTIPIRGVNDAPIAEFDEFATTNFTPLTIQASSLLVNDLDIDRTDSIRIANIEETSSWGATAKLVWNDSHTEIRQVIYDPSTSAQLRDLDQGQQLQDQVTYEIVDQHGETATSGILITVTGEQRVLRIQTIAPQYLAPGLASSPIVIPVEDPDRDPTDLLYSAEAVDSALIPSAGLQLADSGAGYWTLSITPAAQLSGRTDVTVTVRGPNNQSATRTFRVTVGTETDTDLDGVPNAVEDRGGNSGDMNLDGIPDREQGNVATLAVGPQDHFVCLSVPSSGVLSQVTAEAAGALNGTALDATLPLGQIRFQMDMTAGGTVTTNWTTDYSATDLNRVFLNVGGNWSSWMYDKRDGARVFGDRVELQIRDGGRGDSDQAANGQFAGIMALGNVARPWRNTVREDIDNDGVIAPNDVLILINQINSFGSRSLGMIPTGGQALAPFLDPSGNNSLEPLDALIVINFLNNRAAGGEGEPSGMVVIPPTQDDEDRADPVRQWEESLARVLAEDAWVEDNLF